MCILLLLLQVLQYDSISAAIPAPACRLWTHAKDETVTADKLTKAATEGRKNNAVSQVVAATCDNNGQMAVLRRINSDGSSDGAAEGAEDIITKISVDGRASPLVQDGG